MNTRFILTLVIFAIITIFNFRPKIINLTVKEKGLSFPCLLLCSFPYMNRIDGSEGCWRMSTQGPNDCSLFLWLHAHCFWPFSPSYWELLRLKVVPFLFQSHALMEILALLHILNSSSCQDSRNSDQQDGWNQKRGRVAFGGNFRMWQYLKIKAPLHEWTF